MEVMERPEKVEEPRLAKSLKFMDKVSMRIALIVSNLLAFSRETSRESRESSGVNALLDRALMLLERRFESGKIRIVRKFDKNLPSLLMNRGQIEQAFMNVLLNSSDAMPEGGVITIATGLGPSQQIVTVVVEDTGCGIAQENLSKIFDPFFTTKPPGRGTGLGLSISHGIVTKHGGSIRIESEPGKGALLRISLPVQWGKS